jgi:phosphoribosylanthranilate isomerase
MTLVMMCGTKYDGDVELLVQAGVNAAGLITEVGQDIACKLSREEAWKLVRLLPPFISSVLIITEENIDEIFRMVDYVKPDVLQVHGFNTPEDIALLKEKLDVKIIKTLHFCGAEMIEGRCPGMTACTFLAAGADAILVDSANDKKVGSTGLVMSLDVAKDVRDAAAPAPLILAGGLNSDNVADAIRIVRPFAVDVFSGVTVNGHLNKDKMVSFMKAVRKADENE